MCIYIYIYIHIYIYIFFSPPHFLIMCYSWRIYSPDWRFVYWPATVVNLFSGLASFSLFLSFSYLTDQRFDVTCQSSSVSSHTAAHCRPVKAPQNPFRQKSCNIRNWNTARNSEYSPKCRGNCCLATSSAGVVSVGYRSPLYFVSYLRLRLVGALW